MTTPKGEQVISSGWSTAGITNALKHGETYLEPLDSFADIDPLVSGPSVEQDDSNIFQMLFNISCPKMKTIPATQSGSLKMEMSLMLWLRNCDNFC